MAWSQDVDPLSNGSCAARNAAAKAVSLISDSKCETEIMLRELQHRMENNLQVIVSFLALSMSGHTSKRHGDRMKNASDLGLHARVPPPAAVSF
jgi:hypothetical protein